MVTFVFSKFAEKRFKRLGHAEQQRVIAKLQELKIHPDIVFILKPLHGFNSATHRLRIGNYRLIIQFIQQTFEQIELFILDIGHRRDIYQ